MALGMSSMASSENYSLRLQKPVQVTRVFTPCCSGPTMGHSRWQACASPSNWLLAGLQGPAVLGVQVTSQAQGPTTP